MVLQIKESICDLSSGKRSGSTWSDCAQQDTKASSEIDCMEVKSNPPYLTGRVA